MKKTELAYYLTTYKLEGHETWRMHLGRHKDSLDREVENQKKTGQAYPHIINRNVMKFDRITGTFSTL